MSINGSFKHSPTKELGSKPDLASIRAAEAPPKTDHNSIRLLSHKVDLNATEERIAKITCDY